MIEEELIKVWQSSPHEEQVKFDKSRLMIDVQSNLDRFHKGMKALYLRETIAALIVIPIFLLYVFIIPILLSQISSILIVIFGIFIIALMKRLKKKKPEEHSMSYLEYLRKTRDYLALQKKLREKIVIWYIGPCMLFCFTFMLGIILEKGSGTNHIIGAAIYCLLIGGVIYFLNIRSAKKFVAPKLEKVNNLIKTLEEE